MQINLVNMQNMSKNSSSDVFGLDTPKVWDTDGAFQQLQTLGKADSKRTAERRLQELKLLPVELTEQNLQVRCVV